jgi:hypothetical protein
MGAPSEITRLVDQFTRNADAYRPEHYNEAQVRVEFIDPFFKCLGWDIEEVAVYDCRVTLDERGSDSAACLWLGG